MSETTNEVTITSIHKQTAVIGSNTGNTTIHFNIGGNYHIHVQREI